MRSRKTLINQQDILSMKCQLIIFECTECIEALKKHGPHLSESLLISVPHICQSLLRNVDLLTKNKRLLNAFRLFNLPKRTSLYIVCCFQLIYTNGHLSMAHQRWWTTKAPRLKSNPVCHLETFLPDCWLLPNWRLHWPSLRSWWILLGKRQTYCNVMFLLSNQRPSRRWSISLSRTSQLIVSVCLGLLMKTCLTDLWSK